MKEEFITYKDFMESEDFKKYKDDTKVLIADLFAKLDATEKIFCKVSIRGEYDFVLVPDEIINAGRANKGSKGKNLLTVFCNKQKDGIDIETYCKKRKNYLTTDDINEELIKLLIKKYEDMVAPYKVTIEDNKIAV